MRVLHLPDNIASQIQISVGALREIGVEARGLITLRNEIHSSEGIENYAPLLADTSRRSWRWLRDRASAYRAVLSAISWSDVVHYHFAGSFALPGHRDIRWARMRGKKGMISFWGTDIRISQIECQDNPYFAAIYPGFPKWVAATHEKSRTVQAIYARHGFECVLGSESMLPHVDRSLFPQVHLIRCGIRVGEFEPTYPDPTKRKVVVVHSPTDPVVKGTSAVLSAVETLQRRGLPFEFVLVQNTPRAEALRILRDADIFLDQFVLGAYGMASIEAMSLGKPVVCYIKPSLVREYPPDLPIVNATQERLAETLEQLIVDGDLRYKLGQQGRAFVEKFHDARAAAEQMKTLYERLLGRATIP